MNVCDVSVYQQSHQSENVNPYLNLAVQYYTSYLTSLIFTFLISKRETKMSLSHGYCEVKRINVLSMLIHFISQYSTWITALDTSNLRTLVF